MEHLAPRDLDDPTPAASTLTTADYVRLLHPAGSICKTSVMVRTVPEEFSSKTYPVIEAPRWIDALLDYDANISLHRFHGSRGVDRLGVTLEYINAKRQELLSGGTVSLSASVGIAAHYWQSAFAMLDVSPEPLPADMLSAIGLDLPMRGQSVWHIRAEGDELAPARAAYWGEVSTGYVLHIPHVDRTETVRALSGEVLDLRINASAMTPWRGRSPFELMGLSPTLIAEIENAMSGAMPMAGQGFLPMPSTIAPEESSKALAGLRSGSLATIKSKSDHAYHTGGDRAEFKRVELTPDLQKLDANKFTDDLHLRVLAAAGVPPALVTAQGNAGAMREAYRLFALQTVMPLSRQMLPELKRKLGVSGLSVDQMMSADVAGRARAVGILTGAGVDLDKAMKLAGWGEQT